MQRSIRTLYPYALSVRSIRTLYPHALSVRSIRTLYPYALPVRTTRTLYSYALPARGLIFSGFISTNSSVVFITARIDSIFVV